MKMRMMRRVLGQALKTKILNEGHCWPSPSFYRLLEKVHNKLLLCLIFVFVLSNTGDILTQNY